MSGSRGSGSCADRGGERDRRGVLKRLTIGGFFASRSDIGRLNAKWRDALEGEGLSSFHMKEIASDEHAYADRPADRRRRLDRFVDILCECAGEFGAFNYVGGSVSRAFVAAYEPGLNRVMRIASSLSERTDEQGNVVFEHTDEIKQEMIGRYFDRLKWGEYLDGYSVLSSRCTPALQAAEQGGRDGVCGPMMGAATTPCELQSSSRSPAED